MTISLFLQTIFLGFGLSMDACIVCMADGLNNTNISKTKMIFIAISFGFFQGLMPFIGFLVGSAIIQHIKTYIPYFTLFILCFLGYKMVVDGIKHDSNLNNSKKLTPFVIISQSIGTSIDALSIGITLASYSLINALISSLIIGIVTFIICFIGFILGKQFGLNIGNRAEIIGGVILIILGLEMFLTSVF